MDTDTVAPNPPGVAIYIRKFGKELHQRIRVRAAREGITIRDFIMRACSNELRRSGADEVPAPTEIEGRRPKKRA